MVHRAETASSSSGMIYFANRSDLLALNSGTVGQPLCSENIQTSGLFLHLSIVKEPCQSGTGQLAKLTGFYENFSVGRLDYLLDLASHNRQSKAQEPFAYQTNPSCRLWQLDRPYMPSSIAFQGLNNRLPRWSHGRGLYHTGRI
jgi:hypothetical protein